MGRQEGGQFLGHTDRAHAGTTTAVRDAEGFVQVDVANVGTVIAGAGQAHLRVEVGAVEVNEAAVFVHHLSDLADGLFENAVGRRVGDHQRRQLGSVLGGFGAQIAEVDIALIVAGDDHHVITDHHRRSRIGAVRRNRNQADRAEVFTAGMVPGADRHQAGVFALGAGIGLQADGGKTADFGQPAFEQAEHLAVPGGLVGRSEGMQLGEFRPGDGDHLGGRVELHGAGAERDHRSGERKILGLQPVQEAQHLVFGVVPVEYRMAEELGRACQCGREGGIEAGGQRFDAFGGREFTKKPQQRDQLSHGDLFVEGDRHPFGVQLAQIEPGRGRGRDHLGGIVVFGRHHHGVEEGRFADRMPAATQGFGQGQGRGVDPAGDGAQAFWSVVDRIHTRHDGEQHLRRADIAGGLFAADVLFAGLQRHAEGFFATGIARNADDAAGHQPFVFIAGGQERGMRAAETHGHPETLRAADGDVGTQLTWRPQVGERQEVGGDDRHHAGFPRLRHQRAVILQRTIGGGVLQQDAENVAAQVEGRRIFDAQGKAITERARFEHGERLRMAIGRRQEGIFFAAGHGVRHGHGFGRGRTLVEQGGVGDRQTREVGDHRLVSQQRFEPALGDFRLVRGVLGIPARIFQDVAQDHRRHDASVVTLADERTQHFIATGQRTQPAQRLVFPEGAGRIETLELEQRLAVDRRRHGLVDQLGHRADTNGAQHGFDRGGAGAQMAADKSIGRGERRGGSEATVAWAHARRAS